MSLEVSGRQRRVEALRKRAQDLKEMMRVMERKDARQLLEAERESERLGVLEKESDVELRKERQKKELLDAKARCGWCGRLKEMQELCEMA